MSSMDGPWDFNQARHVAARASAQQLSAEEFLKQAYKDFAVAEETYRLLLAQEIVRQHDHDGVAWTVAPDLARGNKQVAAARAKRDIAEGVKEAAAQQAWRAAADRRTAERLIEWSMRRELAEGYDERLPDDHAYRTVTGAPA